MEFILGVSMIVVFFVAIYSVLVRSTGKWLEPLVIIGLAALLALWICVAGWLLSQ